MTSLSKILTNERIKMKKIVTLLAVLLVACLSLASCGLAVPRPEVKEGRFNFSVTYELNGEVKTLECIYVCEFDGTSWSLEGGDYSRDWKAHTEGDFEGDDYSAIIGKTEDGGDIILFFGIYPEYFMGDPNTGDRGIPEPDLYISYTMGEGEYGLVQEEDVIEEVYGAKILDYEYDEPIENTFALFDF